MVAWHSVQLNLANKLRALSLTPAQRWYLTTALDGCGVARHVCRHINRHRVSDTRLPTDIL